MYLEVHSRIKKIDRQIQEISYMLVEAENEEYENLSDQLERLEAEKDELMILAYDMEYLQDYGD